MKRTIRVVGNVAYVALTKGYEAVIDAADIALVENYNWQAQELSHTVYARRVTPRDVHGRQKTIYMHNAILTSTAGYLTDHEDRDGLNNRRKNLRSLTLAESNQNRGMLRNNTSGYTGVYQAYGQWAARIAVRGNRLFLGLFVSKETAALAYKTARELHHVQ